MPLLQRMIKISIATVLATLLSNYLGLMNPLSSGIIALLTVVDSRTASLKRGFSYLFAAVIGFSIASLTLYLFGFDYWTIGIYLLLFIPILDALDLNNTLSPISVLVTHFMVAESISWKWQINGMSLIAIGVFSALLVNWWMPSQEDILSNQVERVENKMRKILDLMSVRLASTNSNFQEVASELNDLEAALNELEANAMLEYDNQLFNKDSYHVRYTHMRKRQLSALRNMNRSLNHLQLTYEENLLLSKIFLLTAKELDESNTGITLLEDLAELFLLYQRKELPKTRKEFETRAVLYSLMLTFERFLQMKHDFYQRDQKKKVADEGKGLPSRLSRL